MLTGLTRERRNRIPLRLTFTEPLMSDSRPVDQPQNDAFRARLEEWLNQQNQSLLEEVIATGKRPGPLPPQ